MTKKLLVPITAALIGAAQAGGLEDIKHVILFMQGKLVALRFFFPLQKYAPEARPWY